MLSTGCPLTEKPAACCIYCADSEVCNLQVPIAWAPEAGGTIVIRLVIEPGTYGFLRPQPSACLRRWCRAQRRTKPHQTRHTSAFS